MLVSQEPTRFDIPHESGEWVEILKLPWSKLRNARKAAEKDNREIAKDFGAEFVKAIADVGDDAEKKAKRVLRSQRYDESQFDTEVLLNAAVKAWSYGPEVNEELLRSLDEETVVWLKQTIVDFTRPPTEEETKND